MNRRDARAASGSPESLRLGAKARGVEPHHGRQILPSYPRSSAAMFARGSTPSPRVYLCSLVSARKSSPKVLSGLEPLPTSETKQWTTTHRDAAQSIASPSPPSPTLPLCLLSVVQHFGSVFSCRKSGARMPGKRKTSSLWTHGPRRPTSTNQKSVLLEQPPRVEMVQGEKSQPVPTSVCPVAYHLWPLFVSVVWCPTSHACRESLLLEGTGSIYCELPPRESASRRGGPRRHTHAGRLGFVAQRSSAGACVGQRTWNYRRAAPRHGVSLLSLLRAGMG